MKALIFDDEAPHDVRVEIRADGREESPTPDAVLKATGANYERVLDSVRRLVLAELREAARTTLVARLGREHATQVGDEPCDAHGIELRRCGCRPDANAVVKVTFDQRLVASMADELARNLTQTIVGLLDVEEG